MAESQGKAPQRLMQLMRMFLTTMDDVSNRKNVDVVPKRTTAIQEQIMVPDAQEEGDIPYPLTDEEALNFLENILHIPKPLELLERDHLEFLNVFLLHMNTEIPFHQHPDQQQNS